MIDLGIYGGGLYGPSIRSGNTPTLIGNRETGRLVPRTPAAAAPVAPRRTPPGKPKKPKAKAKPEAKPEAKAKAGTSSYNRALKDLQAQLDKFWAVPKLQVPTLQLPTLAEPELTSADLESFNVQPLAIGALPTLEAAPAASPVTAIPDRHSAQMRAAKLQEIDRLKRMSGYQSTMLATGGRGDTRRALTRKGV